MPRGDLANLLRSMALADGAVAATSTKRANSVEVGAGWAYERRSDVGTATSGRVRLARRGARQLRASSQRTLQACFPSIAMATCPLLWDLVRKRIPSIDDALAGLGDRAFWSLHDAAVRWRVFASPKDPLTDEDLGRLALQGTYEAVAVLWLLVTATTSDGWPDVDKFHIARYLPPALAILSLNPSAARIAYVLFARARQLTLDALSGGEGWLWLANYDLREVARTFPDEKGQRIANSPDGQKIVAQMWWLQHHLAPLTTRPWRRSRLWVKGLSPRERLSSDPRVMLVPLALDVMTGELGAYFG